jgi:hypothetical protein
MSTRRTSRDSVVVRGMNARSSPTGTDHEASGPHAKLSWSYTSDKPARLARSS